MIAVLDYEAGNLTSVELALKHVGGKPNITREPADVARAERVVFPGVGSAASCMHNLRRRGLDKALRQALEAGKPVLAICIGLQLLFEHSAEDGGADCLGVLPGEVKRFSFSEERHVKIPHMGWNEVMIKRPHPLLKDFPAGGECYFVHSYYVESTASSLVATTTEYEGAVFCSAAGEDNLFAAQFHPEKSGAVGLDILRNFLAWDGQPC